jgi:hypothetical protein
MQSNVKHLLSNLGIDIDLPSERTLRLARGDMAVFKAVKREYRRLQQLMIDVLDNENSHTQSCEDLIRRFRLLGEMGHALRAVGRQRAVTYRIQQAAKEFETQPHEERGATDFSGMGDA